MPLCVIPLVSRGSPGEEKKYGRVSSSSRPHAVAHIVKSDAPDRVAGGRGAGLRAACVGEPARRATPPPRPSPECLALEGLHDACGEHLPVRRDLPEALGPGIRATVGGIEGPQGGGGLSGWIRGGGEEGLGRARGRGAG